MLIKIIITVACGVILAGITCFLVSIYEAKEIDPKFPLLNDDIK